MNPSPTRSDVAADIVDLLDGGEPQFAPIVASAVEKGDWSRVFKCLLTYCAQDVENHGVLCLLRVARYSIESGDRDLHLQLGDLAVSETPWPKKSAALLCGALIDARLPPSDDQLRTFMKIFVGVDFDVRASDGQPASSGFERMLEQRVLPSPEAMDELAWFAPQMATRYRPIIDAMLLRDALQATSSGRSGPFPGL